MRIGLFGGTFDPPHIAHLILAADACTCQGLDQVLWVLTPDPPHKDRPDLLPSQTRLRLVKAAIRNNEKFLLSTLELDRPGPHYAVDTMRAAKILYPHAAIYYIMGGDSLHDLPNWRNPREFINICEGICVMRRPQDSIEWDDLDGTFPDLRDKVHFMDLPQIEISSSLIRNRIRENLPYRYFLPDSVYRIIIDEGLYR